MGEPAQSEVPEPPVLDFEPILAAVKEWQEANGVEPISDDEAMALAVAEQKASRRERTGEPSS